MGLNRKSLICLPAQSQKRDSVTAQTGLYMMESAGMRMFSSLALSESTSNLPPIQREIRQRFEAIEDLKTSVLCSPVRRHNEMQRQHAILMQQQRALRAAQPRVRKVRRRRKRPKWSFDVHGPRHYGAADHAAATTLARSRLWVLQRRKGAAMQQIWKEEKAARVIQKMLKGRMARLVFRVMRNEREEMKAATVIANKYRQRTSMKDMTFRKSRRLSALNHWDFIKSQMQTLVTKDCKHRNSMKMIKEKQKRAMPMLQEERDLLVALRDKAEMSEAMVTESLPGSLLVWSGNYHIQRHLAYLEVHEQPNGTLFISVNYYTSITNECFCMEPKQWKSLGYAALDALTHTETLKLCKKICEELTAMDMPEPDMLDGVPLFKDMNPAVRTDLLRKVRKREFRADRIVCRQGEPGDGMYFVTKGQLKVFVEQKLVAMLKENSFFGEVALIDSKGLRTATVRTFVDSELYLLLRRDFNDVLELHPDFMQSIKTEHRYLFGSTKLDTADCAHDDYD